MFHKQQLWSSSSPFTPVDQTLKTPLEAPQHQTEFPLQHQFQLQQQGYHGNVNQSSLYQNRKLMNLMTFLPILMNHAI